MVPPEDHDRDDEECNNHMQYPREIDPNFPRGCSSDVSAALQPVCLSPKLPSGSKDSNQNRI